MPIPTHKKTSNVKTRSIPKMPPSPVIGLLRAAVTALGCGILALLLVCAVLLSTENPGAYAPLAAALIPFPIALVCGILSAKQSSLGGLISGILGGAVFCLLLFLLGFAVPRGDTSVVSPLSLPIRAGVCLALSAIGGYGATHKKPRAHHRRRHP